MPNRVAPVDFTAEEYADRVSKALQPALLPLATSWIKAKHGPEAQVNMRFIYVHPSGTVELRADATVQGNLYMYSLYYTWRDGWKLTEAERQP